MIPFDRNKLADYLCIARSAMLRELGKMRDEGILKFEKNGFTYFASIEMIGGYMIQQIFKKI